MRPNLNPPTETRQQEMTPAAHEALRTRRNAGSFKPGPDSRRHRFTREECVEGGRRGFQAALEAITLRYDDDRARTFGKFLRREGRFA